MCHCEVFTPVNAHSSRILSYYHVITEHFIAMPYMHASACQQHYTESVFINMLLCLDGNMTLHITNRYASENLVNCEWMVITHTRCLSVAFVLMVKNLLHILSVYDKHLYTQPACCLILCMENIPIHTHVYRHTHRHTSAFFSC